MTPEKALELVGRYARLTREIKLATNAIGYSLEACRGFSGERGSLIALHREQKLDSKGRDLDCHLVVWYTPEVTGDGYYSEGRLSWESIEVDEHGVECPACYAAHLAIQNRKDLRKQLAIVKRSMSRSAA